MFKNATEADKKTVNVVLESRVMKEAERLQILGKMSAVIAHEIRNPLAGITAVTQVLEGKLERDDPRRQYVSLILKEIDRVNKLVHDLLDYTRETKPYFLVTCPSSIINRALTYFSKELGEKNIVVKREYSPDEIKVPLDQEKMERVFRNIIQNSIEAIDGNGQIVVSVNQVNGKEGESKGVEVVITDNGKGIVTEDLNNLFSPFYTTKSKGTGLGLAVAMKLVEEHKGRIWAERNTGKGISMHIFLPGQDSSNNKEKQQH